MKQNRLKKYSLMVTFLFIGLFLCGTDTYAKELICNYSFDFTYEHATSGGTFESVSGTADFQLVVDNSEKASGWENYTKYQLKVTGNYSIDPRYPVGPSSKTVYINSSADQCPTVTIYQRRTGITGNINSKQFYLFSENEKSYNETASDLINACSGKDADDEVLSGYRCGNIIGQISGTKAITSCDETEIKEIINKKKEIFRTNVEAAFNNEYNRLNSEASSFSSTTTQAICDEYKNKWDKTVLDAPLLKFGSESQNLLDNLECKIDEATKQELSNYDTAGRKTITFYDKAKSYTNSLLATFENNLDKCYKNATDMTEEEKQEAEEDVDNLREESEKDMDESTSAIIDEYLKYVDKITSISLGTPTEIDCEGLLGDDLLNLISEIFGYVQIAAPILLLVLGSVDFGQAVLSDDKDALKKATSKFAKRAIICVAIFFAPLILKYLLGFLNDIGKDPLCGIK